MERAATLSDDGMYRYRLSRHWDRSLPEATFIMLNPSTADAEIDDPTIRKCVGFAQRWGMGGLNVGNLFAFRATRPDAMMRAADPVGPENDDHLWRLCESAAQSQGIVICAWGANGGYRGRDKSVLRLIVKEVNISPQALMLTPKGRAPQHPLYVPYDVKPCYVNV